MIRGPVKFRQTGQVVIHQFTQPKLEKIKQRYQARKKMMES
jgi:hypothetical protein